MLVVLHKPVNRFSYMVFSEDKVNHGMCELQVHLRLAFQGFRFVYTCCYYVYDC